MSNATNTDTRHIRRAELIIARALSGALAYHTHVVEHDVIIVRLGTEASKRYEQQTAYSTHRRTSGKCTRQGLHTRVACGVAWLSSASRAKTTTR